MPANEPFQLSSKPSRYPFMDFNQRQLTGTYQGPVCIWDIDKTYLDTRFSSLKGLSRIPFEFAADKQSFAGIPKLMQDIRRGTGDGYACTPLYFISASPHQLRSVLERKLLLDGVAYDGLILKNWLGVLRSLKPRRLLEQVGFKVNALLSCRRYRPQAREYLFGDDVEQDPIAFGLYADLVAGKIQGGEAEVALKAAGVARYDRQLIHEQLNQLQPLRPLGRVEALFIHRLRRETKLANPLVRPYRDAHQLRRLLEAEGLVNPYP